MIKRYRPADLCIAALVLVLIALPAQATAADKTDDAFLAGYITSILERDLHWEPGSYHMKVARGVVTITLFNKDPARQKQGKDYLNSIDGLRKVSIVVESAAPRQSTINKILGLSGKTETFPVGDMFQPLIADPKQARFFVGFNHVDSAGRVYTGASVGFGETFGMYKYLGVREGNGLQLSVEGGLFAQFDMDSPSHDLINADYTIGIPVTYQRGAYSLHFRIYHQSSHLGDEYLLRQNSDERINLSFESAKLILSRQWRSFRVYAGGEYLIHKEPSDLKPAIGQWGVEYLGSKPVAWGGRMVGGVDIKYLEEHQWAADVSTKAGLEFGVPYPGQRRLRVMAQWYRGYDQSGQFYDNKTEYYGMEVSLGF